MREPRPMPAVINVVVDVWGGENSGEHVARAMLSVPLALQMAEMELRAGYLVNLRGTVGWGPEQDFDKRSAQS